MNQRRKVAAATAILAVLAVLIGRIVWRVEKNKTRDRVSEASLSVAKMPASLLASPSASSLPPAAPNHDIVTRSDLLASLNHRQITFFGHVVDQFDAPVSGAEIHAQVTYNTGDTSGVTKRTLVTDSGGNFALVGVSGRTLDFNILKPGYNFIAEQDAYDYTAIVPEHKRHHPDPNKPVVLHMWKLQGGESLVEKRKLTKVISDGRPYRFDLMTGDLVSSGGDLILRLFHGQQEAGSQVARYDWRAEVIAPDGGLRQENQRIEHMYLAPSEGYTEQIAIEMPAQSADWARAYNGNFYLKVRRNLYCRLAVDLHTIPINGSSYVNVTWWLNPNPGSRNLEGPQITK